MVIFGTKPDAFEVLCVFERLFWLGLGAWRGPVGSGGVSLRGVVVEFCARSKLLLTFVGFGLLLFVQLSSLRSQLDFVLLMFVINLLFVWFVSLQMFVVLLLMFKVVLPVPLLDLFLMLLLLTFPSLCRGPDLSQRVSINILQNKPRSGKITHSVNSLNWKKHFILKGGGGLKPFSFQNQNLRRNPAASQVCNKNMKQKKSGRF